MPILRMACVCVWGLVLVSCKGVYSDAPIGEKPVELVARDWEGVWFGDGGAMTIKLVDRANGVLRTAWVDEEEKSFKLTTYRGHLRSSHDWMFCSLENYEGSEKFLWGRIKRNNNQIVFWLPRIDKVRALVQDGVLPGAIDEDDNVTLAVLDPAQLDVITSGSHGLLLEWEQPIVFTRLSH